MTVRRRVLLCCEQYYPSVGGVQEVMRQIAERLALRNLEVVVATGIHPQRPDDVMMNGVQVVSFAITGNRVKGMAGPVADYQQFLKDGHFDAVLIKAAQQWTFDAAVDVVDQLSARKVFIPCGFSGLADASYADYFDQMPTWLRQFDALIFYSDTYQDIEFARKHGLSALHLIPNGVDEREFLDAGDQSIRTEIGIAPGDDLLLSVGSMIMAKGHWEALEAFGRARLERPTTLVLNGNLPRDGSAALLKRAVKHALSGRWPLSMLAARINRQPGKRVLLTDLPRIRLLQLFKAADLFVFASHVEYSPLVLFEAAASGTPFIASNAGNSKEIATWTGGGTIVQETSADGRTPDAKSFAAAIESALGDRVALRAQGVAARRAMLHDGFTWSRIVDDYARVLGLA
jgi:glycosyltransferase involved in cell wall biosynthesis